MTPEEIAAAMRNWGSADADKRAAWMQAWSRDYPPSPPPSPPPRWLAKGIGEQKAVWLWELSCYVESELSTMLCTCAAMDEGDAEIIHFAQREMAARNRAESNRATSPGRTPRLTEAVLAEIEALWPRLRREHPRANQEQILSHLPEHLLVASAQATLRALRKRGKIPRT